MITCFVMPPLYSAAAIAYKSDDNDIIAAHQRFMREYRNTTRARKLLARFREEINMATVLAYPLNTLFEDIKI